ncbi:MAG: hypothetical protein R3C40_01090 [Parvularculaceae bacterium]
MTQTLKSQRYKEVAQEIAAVIDGETNLTARMATVSNILHHAFDHYYWTGFYLVDPQKGDELVIGPYQGTLDAFVFRSKGRAAPRRARARRKSSKTFTNLPVTLHATRVQSRKSWRRCSTNPAPSSRCSMSIATAKRCSTKTTGPALRRS